MNNSRLHLYSKFLTAATLVLIAAGGLVTSTRSGLSVPDWPLSYGKLFPPMIGGIRFEHTHRVIAGLVGVLTLVLMIALLKTEKRPWLKGLGVAAFGAVIAQAVLGGLTVKYLLPAPISVLHACLAQSFFALMASVALFTSREWLGEKPILSENAASLRRLVLATSGFVFLQLFLGAVARHSANRASVGIHIAVAFLIVLHALLTYLKISREKTILGRLDRHAALFGLLALIQIFLGFGSFVFTRMLEKTEAPRLGAVLFTTAHQTLGALILGLVVLLTIRIFRLYQKPL
ncbi:MAG: COX15/CtaA family protein [Candidatus Omnitrophica bacterium]|nr:COX15/CtaA family protein [Candidatus Omnitrophota bacterium]